jgi:hypothetical protein
MRLALTYCHWDKKPLFWFAWCFITGIPREIYHQREDTASGIPPYLQSHLQLSSMLGIHKSIDSRMHRMHRTALGSCTVALLHVMRCCGTLQPWAVSSYDKSAGLERTVKIWYLQYWALYFFPCFLLLYAVFSCKYCIWCNSNTCCTKRQWDTVSAGQIHKFCTYTKDLMISRSFSSITTTWALLLAFKSPWVSTL